MKNMNFRSGDQILMSRLAGFEGTGVNGLDLFSGLARKDIVARDNVVPWGASLYQ